jgi:excisionase family DNA binding protein
MKDSPWLTPKEAADYLKLSRSYIYNLISAREITSYKINNAVRLSIKDLENYMRRKERPAIN